MTDIETLGSNFPGRAVDFIIRYYLNDNFFAGGRRPLAALTGWSYKNLVLEELKDLETLDRERNEEGEAVEIRGAVLEEEDDSVLVRVSIEGT